MATPLDASIIGHFNVVFVFLFVLVAMYAVLMKIKIFGDNQFINLVSSLVLALLFSSSSFAVRVFEVATPWLVLLFLLFLILQLMFAFIGGESDALSVKNGVTASLVVVVVLLIFFMSIAEVTADEKQPLIDSGEISEGEPTSFAGKVGGIVRHPAILGLILILLIASFAIAMLAAKPQ